MIKAIFIFYVFQFSPRTIDHNTHKFWRNSVGWLNKLRADNNYAFHLWEFKNVFFIRDPHAYPVSEYFTSSRWHPFSFRKKFDQS